MLNPFLLPHAVNGRRPSMEALTDWFLDRTIEFGRMDLVLDLANPVPAVVTMQPSACRGSTGTYADLFHTHIASRPGAPEYERAMARVPDIMAELLVEAEARRAHPRDDSVVPVGGDADCGRPPAQ